MEPLTILSAATLACVAVAAAILLWYLVQRPALDRRTKLLLLLGVGVLPIGAAITGNLHGFEVSKERTFCASCHVMEPYVRQATDPESSNLAALHTRNTRFGEQACYTCHRDYGVFGTVVTKLDGMRHFAAYWMQYRGAGATPPIRLYRPYPAGNCTQCHSGTLPGFLDEPEHQAVMAELKAGTIGCTTSGCHGPSHGVGR